MKHDVLLIGGSGFVGTAITRLLHPTNRRVLVPSRRYSAAGETQPTPTSNLTFIEADVHRRPALQRLLAQLKPTAAVINLVGVLQDRRAHPYGPGFGAAHVELPQLIVQEMQALGLRRYLHMSALGAHPQGASMYQRSKGDGQRLVEQCALDWTIFRPSVIFGAQDQFINTFVRLAQLLPVLALAHAQALFQPVSVHDVASAFIMALDDPRTIGGVYDLVGPEVLSMQDLVRFAIRKAGRRTAVLPVPDWVGYLQALAFEYGPWPTLMSRDNIASMRVPNVLPAGGRDALSADFGLIKQRLGSL